MVGDQVSRSLLPQTTQSQTLSFVTSNPTPREPLQRNYVFVDEHNRHKRLKVMRACEGCRRRKIKCDAATTNTWPCAACTRLKLTCVPPTVSYDKDSSTSPGIHTFEIQRAATYPTVSVAQIQDLQRQGILQQQLYGAVGSTLPSAGHAAFAEASGYQAPVFIDSTGQQDVLDYSPLRSSTLASQDFSSPYYPSPGAHPHSASIEKSEFPSWKSESGVSSIVDAFGELKIDHLAQAAFITEHKLAETPAVEEFEIQLPKAVSTDKIIRIHPEMMPSEEEALRMIHFFFSHSHPFVPVLSRQAFLHQWQTARESISPLLIEAIFACATGVMENNPKNNKWLALATKHEDSFRDVPRVSTIQAMLIMLKARETAPRRGYFYRSWMVLVNLVAMGKDLGLNTHHQMHKAGISCGLDPFECLSRSRIWQVMFVLEVMVGGPQGRSDFGITEDTLNFDEPPLIPGIDDSEYDVWRQFTYLTQIIKLVRKTVKIYAEKKHLSPPWAMTPEYRALDREYNAWLSKVPQDLCVVLPQDDSPPYIPTSFIGHLQSYHYLSIIMHHRPQIHYLTAPEDHTRLQHHMRVCHDAAKSLCRIQESMLRSHGIHGMVAMLRGMNFTIYCILTCNMIHLASITNPEDSLSIEARDYFVRHMQLLEACAPAWSMLEMRSQIDALREAFSKDTSKPFELNDHFPYASSPARSQTSPFPPDTALPNVSGSEVPLDQRSQIPYSMIHPITPPVSTVCEDEKADSPPDQPLALMPDHTHGQQSSGASAQPVPGQWNPTKLFDQWSVAFGPPPPDAATTASANTVLPNNPFELRSPTDLSQSPYTPSSPYSPHGPSQMQLPPNAMGAPRSYSQASYVSPSMWQDVVASTFGEGVKRRWDYSSQQDMGPMAKRHR